MSNKELDLGGPGHGRTLEDGGNHAYKKDLGET